MSQLGKLAMHTNSSKVFRHCGSKVRAMLLKRVVMDALYFACEPTVVSM